MSSKRKQTLNIAGHLGNKCVLVFLCRLYAMFRMVECVKSELKSMKHGLYNVIPMELLSGITAEVGEPCVLCSALVHTHPS